ncbi:MAG: hypothetical protein WBC76_05255 [Actinomycetes bacterium]
MESGERGNSPYESTVRPQVDHGGNRRPLAGPARGVIGRVHIVLWSVAASEVMSSSIMGVLTVGGHSSLVA